MEEQCSPLSWSYCYLEEGIEEFKNSILYSTLELEAAVVSGHEEISRRDEEIVQLKGVVTKIIKERDEFKAKCNTLVFEKQLLLQQMQTIMSSKQHLECPLSSGTTNNEDDSLAFSPPHSDGNTLLQRSPGAKSPATVAKEVPLVTPSPPVIDVIDEIAFKKPLPENGKFLQAVMEAGPLLQTLLLAGALPQWQHPPPPLNSIDIPPVTISSPVSPNNSGHFSNKRPLVMMNREGSGSGSDLLSPNPKYQKVVHQSSLTPTLGVPIIAQNPHPFHDDFGDNNASKIN